MLGNYEVATFSYLVVSRVVLSSIELVSWLIIFTVVAIFVIFNISLRRVVRRPLFQTSSVESHSHRMLVAYCLYVPYPCRFSGIIHTL
jgi:hypothetical protein